VALYSYLDFGINQKETMPWISVAQAAAMRKLSAWP